MTGRNAGDHIFENAMAFSDRLLDDEEACFARIEHSVGDGLVSREREVRAALKRHRNDPLLLVNDQAVLDSMLEGWRRVCARAERDVAWLVDQALTMSLTAIRAELGYAEATMAEKYRGCAERACDTVEEEIPNLRAAELAAWTATTARTRTELASLTRMQMRAATDAESLIARLFSPVPAGLQGFGGRGVWWQVAASLNATARHIAIHAANTVRTHAIDLFNTEHDRVPE